jgi:hypothetical protein
MKTKAMVALTAPGIGALDTNQSSYTEEAV